MRHVKPMVFLLLAMGMVSACGSKAPDEAGSAERVSGGLVASISARPIASPQQLPPTVTNSEPPLRTDLEYLTLLLNRGCSDGGGAKPACDVHATDVLTSLRTIRQKMEHFENSAWYQPGLQILDQLAGVTADQTSVPATQQRILLTGTKLQAWLATNLR